MIFQGFRFGMILQLAVGPVCLLIFKLASSRGFISAEAGVSAVVLVDTLYILLAILGIASAVGKEKVKRIFGLAGAVIVALFGVSTLAGIAGLQLQPGIQLFSASGGGGEGAFLEALLLTASNPLTILFWAGVFSARITEQNMKRGDVCLFGLGSVLATLFFLTAVAVVGSLTKQYLPAVVVTVMNGAVGIFLLYFAIKMLKQYIDKKAWHH